MKDLKSVTSPKRLFFTTYPVLYTVVEANGKFDDANKLNEFATNLDKERTFFCKYLTRIGCHNQCKTVINIHVKRLKMSWRTTENVYDSGVYLLRHVEVYMGEREGHWNCGLSTRNKGVLQYLRAKYNRVLMVAKHNHSVVLNKAGGSKHYEKDSKKTKINVEKMIANYGS